MSSPSKTPRVVIVGGGFSGAAVALHLARAQVPAEIEIFEPRATLGGGLAYGGADSHLRVNVPARFMSALPEDETHFARWLEAEGVLADDPAAFAFGEAYPRRREFGRYVAATLAPHLASGAIRHRREKLLRLAPMGAGWLAQAERSEVLSDFAVIAATHPPSAPPAELAALVGDPRLIVSPLEDGALTAVPGDARVLIVGAGLTGADLVAGLAAQGHRGAMTMISRHGLRAQSRLSSEPPPEGAFLTPPLRRATALMRAVRAAVREAEAGGRDWRPVFETLRNDGQEIWRALTPDARARVARHMRAYWDAHRFRAAPQVEGAVQEQIARGALTFRRARLGAVTPTSGDIEVELIDRRRGVTTREHFDRVLLAVGPAHRGILASQPLFAALHAEGALTMDPTGLGLAVALDGRALDREGRVNPSLWIAGPLARGTFGELMGLPHVSRYACFIANQVAVGIRSSSLSSVTG